MSLAPTPFLCVVTDAVLDHTVMPIGRQENFLRILGNVCYTVGKLWTIHLAVIEKIKNILPMHEIKAEHLAVY